MGTLAEIHYNHQRSFLPLIHVRAPQNEQPALAAPRPRHQLRKQVRDDHPQARLYVLQREILRGGAPVRLEPRPRTRDEHEQVAHRAHDRVHVQIDVVRADRARELLGAPPRLGRRVLRAHVARVEDPVRELARVGRGVCRVGGLARDAARVRDDVLV